MGRLLFIFILTVAILSGFGVGSGYFAQRETVFSQEAKQEAKEISSFKPFTIVLIANNNETTVQRSLRSIFEQDYENFRLVFIDDGSRDQTFELAREFVIANSQEHRAVLMKNDTRRGFEASLHRAASQCLDAELILPLKAADWFSTSTALARFNCAVQTPGVWVVSAGVIRYPSYDYNPEGVYCFYEALFNRIDQTKPYPKGLVGVPKNKVKHLPDRLLFCSETR